MPHKRNEYLDAGSDDEDPILTADEGAEDSRFAEFRRHASKRRRTSRSASKSKSESEAEAVDLAQPEQRAQRPDDDEGTDGDDTSIVNQYYAESGSQSQPKNVTPPPTDLKFGRPSKKTSKPGIVYLSRIPPFMRPATVRTLLSPFGTISQLFLTPEPPAVYAARKNHGGN